MMGFKPNVAGHKGETMRKFNFVLAMLACALVFGLAFAGCDSETPYEGPEIEDIAIVTLADLGTQETPPNWNPKTSVEVGENFGLLVKYRSQYNDLEGWGMYLKKGAEVVWRAGGTWSVNDRPKFSVIRTGSWSRYSIDVEPGDYTFEFFLIDEGGNRTTFSKPLTITAPAAPL